MNRTMVIQRGPYGEPWFVEIRLYQWRQRFKHFGYRMHRKERRAFLRKVVGRALEPHEVAHCDYLDRVPDALSCVMTVAWHRRRGTKPWHA